MPSEHTDLHAWTRGWAISRGTPAPVKVPSGYRIDVGLPGHLVRYVLPAFDQTLVDRLHHPGTWLKICAETVPLDPRWHVEPTEYLMTTRLIAEFSAEVPEYKVRTDGDGDLVRVTVEHQGSPAARGQAALIGEHAVIDQIVTEPNHRRRGLGTTVMCALADAAVRRGASTGVLVATEDGRALYSRLGWTLVSPVTAAWLSRG